jgi:phosphoribosyl 1,2-cyclic phosphodiesterase
LLFVVGEGDHMIDIRFWGVRGSIAAAGPNTAIVGGNTSCVEVRGPDGELLILDAGTGLRALGAALEKTGVAVRAHLVLSHFHWDHIQGFPFFSPAFRPETELTVLGPERCVGPNGDVRRAFETQMKAPHFPVSLEAMRARLTFRGLPAGQVVRVGGLTLTSGAACHPNGCLAYRIEHGGRAVVYATDTEHDRKSGLVDANLVELARGADLLIYDAQYTAEEYEGRRGPCRHGWGHSTPDEGIRLADAAGVGRLVLFHHDPSHDDAEVERIEREAERVRPGTIAAREGLRLTLSPHGAIEAA